MKFDFSHSKLIKQPFSAEYFKIQGRPRPLPTPIQREAKTSLPTPMLVTRYYLLPETSNQVAYRGFAVWFSGVARPVFRSKFFTSREQQCLFWTPLLKAQNDWICYKLGRNVIPGYAYGLIYIFWRKCTSLTMIEHSAIIWICYGSGQNYTKNLHGLAPNSSWTPLSHLFVTGWKDNRAFANYWIVSGLFWSTVLRAKEKMSRQVVQLGTAIVNTSAYMCYETSCEGAYCSNEVLLSGPIFHIPNYSNRCQFQTCCLKPYIIWTNVAVFPNYILLIGSTSSSALHLPMKKKNHHISNFSSVKYSASFWAYYTT